MTRQQMGTPEEQWEKFAEAIITSAGVARESAQWVCMRRAFFAGMSACFMTILERSQDDDLFDRLEAEIVIAVKMTGIVAPAAGRMQ